MIELQAWTVDDASLYYSYSFFQYASDGGGSMAMAAWRAPIDRSTPPVPLAVDGAMALAVSNECLWWVNAKGVFRAPK